MKKIQYYKGINGSIVEGAVNFPDSCVSGTLPANQNVQIPVPEQANLAVFYPDGLVYISIDGRPAHLPDNSPSAQGNSIRVSNARMLDQRHTSTTQTTQHINLIAPQETTYTISFYL